MPIKNIDAIKIGDVVSYEDMDTPYTEYIIIRTPAEIPASEWGYKYFHGENADGKILELLFDEHGWNHYPQN